MDRMNAEIEFEKKIRISKNKIALKYTVKDPIPGRIFVSDISSETEYTEEIQVEIE